MQSSVPLTELESGEFCGLSGIEILSIPALSILSEFPETDAQSEMDITQKYKNECAIMLAELYQISKKYFHCIDLKQDVSIEFLWHAIPVSNQIFKAKIRLFIVLRVIAKTRGETETRMLALQNICETTFKKQRYTFCNAEEDIVLCYNNIGRKKQSAIVKADRFENLQNQFIQHCYSFEKFPSTESDLSGLTSALIDTPNSAVSFQFIPTYYTEHEANYVAQMASTLDTITKGMHDFSLGNNVTNPTTQKHSELYSYYTDTNSVLFHFNIVIYAEPPDMPLLTAKVFGQICGNTKERLADLYEVDLGRNDIDVSANIFALPWAYSEVIGEKHLELRQFNTSDNSIRRISNIITHEEASSLGRLPIGSKNLNAGFTVDCTKKDIASYRKTVVNAGDISVGKIKKSNDEDKIGITLSDMTKHMLIVGTPGSGKTTFSVSLLDRLWKEHKIPFLVIEPAKNEYRALIDSIPDIQIFTPGKDDVSPYIVNPFVPPKNVKLKAYKTVLKTAFAAGVTMTSPLDKIFEEAINNTYSDFGWLDSYTTDSGADIFNIQDFTKNFSETFESLGYVGEAKNIGRAGLVRLISLTNLFDNYFSTPIEDLLGKPTIIELAAIENSDQKALIIALLLLNVLSYVNANYLGEGNLKNVVLLEEAHVLLDSNDDKGEGEANPSAIAKSLLKRMLAEIRSYGVGIVIADQSPEKVTTDVIKLTNIKISFNLVEKTDKEIFANSTNMATVQIEQLTKLEPGEAFIFMNGLDEPEEVITEDYRARNNIRISIPDEEVAKKSTYWHKNSERLMPYPECRHVKYCNKQCDFERRGLGKEIARRVFSKNFNSETNDFIKLQECYATIERQSIEALRGKYSLSKPLAGCIKMHFLRRVKYGTKTTVSEGLLVATLQKA